MEPAPVDFNSQDFFQPDVAQMNLAAKMFEQRELTGLIGCFEYHRLESESVSETIGESSVQFSGIVEEADR